MSHVPLCLYIFYYKQFKNHTLSQVWWSVPTIPATQEAEPLNTSLNSEVPLLTPENKGYYAFQTSWHLIFGNINANCCF
uniref:Uncharacterized protein n=1 Tax=Castor canadensis TaxID=51338 RepID=A0A8C0ZVJ6_CASCN